MRSRLDLVHWIIAMYQQTSFSFTVSTWSVPSQASDWREMTSLFCMHHQRDTLKVHSHTYWKAKALCLPKQFISRLSLRAQSEKLPPCSPNWHSELFFIKSNLWGCFHGNFWKCACVRSWKRVSIEHFSVLRKSLHDCSHGGHVVNSWGMFRDAAGLPDPADSAHTPGLLFCSCSGLALPATALVSAQDK